MKISHLSFGASSLGSVFRETNEKESFEAVEAAIEGGINFIDVSPYYGHYKAETVLGKALRNIPRDKYYLSTKVGRYGKDGVTPGTTQPSASPTVSTRAWSDWALTIST
jgi:aryl-alcohol dehydrogenase-like predicted oxidoreductase